MHKKYLNQWYTFNLSCFYTAKYFNLLVLYFIYLYHLSQSADKVWSIDNILRFNVF